MRPTWIVLGVVGILAGVAYAKLRAKAGAPSANPSLSKVAGPPVAGPSAGGPTDGPNPVGTPAKGADGANSAMSGPNPALAAPAARAETSGSEAEARALVAAIGEKASDAGAVAPLEARLFGELGDTVEARRHGLSLGSADAKFALDEKRPLDARLETALRARVRLSRGLFLPELFDATTGAPTEARVALLRTIASVNAFVMTREGGVRGVTRPYDVAPGDSPVRIVSREKLTCGPAALLFWSQGGNLDPRRLRAGDRLLLPLEVLSVRVSLERHLLGLYLGEAIVKEFRVGVGKASTPTYPGEYEVKDKYQNPDWHSPNGVIPYGDPKNELGDAWIPISSTEKPKGYGIHGTNKPDTVGTDCSNGCVRLRNDEAVEMISWVRTAKGDGQATKVIIR